jgi:hypothetical protein
MPESQTRRIPKRASRFPKVATGSLIGDSARTLRKAVCCTQKPLRIDPQYHRTAWDESTSTLTCEVGCTKRGPAHCRSTSCAGCWSRSASIQTFLSDFCFAASRNQAVEANWKCCARRQAITRKTKARFCAGSAGKCQVGALDSTRPAWNSPMKPKTRTFTAAGVGVGHRQPVGACLRCKEGLPFYTTARCQTANTNRPTSSPRTSAPLVPSNSGVTWLRS